MSVLSHDRWPHQQYAFDRTNACLDAWMRRVCVTIPTGGGKTRCQFDQIQRVEGRALVLSNRRMLLAQHARNARAAGFTFGFRAANYRELVEECGMDLSFHKGETMADRSLQLAMTQTECNRVLGNGEPLHDCEVVLIDEAHLHTSERICKLIDLYEAAGASILGYTATPVDLAPLRFEHLIQAGTTSELRACGALVPAVTFAPDEPDMREKPSAATGEFSENQVVDAMFGRKIDGRKKPAICGRVLQYWRQLNPDALPTLLFSPSVETSIWFAECFQEAGFRAASIDGESIWLDGAIHPTNEPGLREELARQHRDGELAVICNRFVLREGIDWPWVRHGIFATVFGGLEAFIQSGGRLLRKYAGKDHVVVQDHGGNWWRHGSLNSDREWTLGQTNCEASQKRIEDFRRKGKTGAVEPVVCPKCMRTRLPSDKYALRCPYCGHMASHKSRVVLASDGTLSARHGDIFLERKPKEFDDTERLWIECYHRMKKAKRPMTFKQARGLFYYENHYWPPENLPFMPANETGWSRRIRDVPPEELIGGRQRDESEASEPQMNLEM